MITASVDMTGFNQGMAGLVRQLGLSAKLVVKKEVMELMKTLAKTSPPKDKEKTKRDIAYKIDQKFSALNDMQTNFEALHGKESKTGLKFYGANSKYLFAAARDSDMRESDQRTLLGIHYRTKTVQGTRRVIVPFKNRNTNQRVAIASKILTTTKQRNGLIKRIQNRVGRLKAAWLVASKGGRIILSGSNLPPQWVTRHVAGAHGNYVDGLAIQGNPKFTLINFSKGVTERNVVFFVQRALNIRAKAMMENLRQILKGPKKLSDYAKGLDSANRITL